MQLQILSSLWQTEIVRRLTLEKQEMSCIHNIKSELGGIKLEKSLQIRENKLTIRSFK